MAAEDISYEALLDQLHDGVYLVDEHKIVTYWNRGAERITGYNRDEVLGREYAPDFLGHLDENGASLFNGECPISQCLQAGTTREADLLLKHKDGHRVPVYTRISAILNNRGNTIGALEVFSDNTSKVYARQRIEKLEEMALRDPLTGVGNRRHTQMHLRYAFEELRRYGWVFGMLFVDIDHFKRINDAYGHQVGDEVLRMVAHALSASLRVFDFVGRWGGEEFIIILPNITDDVLAMIAERCRRLVEESGYQHEGKELKVTVSIGAVLGNPDDTVEECVERADKLMYQSKAAGRNRTTIEGG